jgi:hypothetical protein
MVRQNRSFGLRALYIAAQKINRLSSAAEYKND